MNLAKLPEILLKLSMAGVEFAVTGNPLPLAAKFVEVGSEEITEAAKELLARKEAAEQLMVALREAEVVQPPLAGRPSRDSQSARHRAEAGCSQAAKTIRRCRPASASGMLPMAPGTGPAGRLPRGRIPAGGRAVGGVPGAGAGAAG